MTPNDMVTLIKARLANSNDATLDALIITVANVVQERLEQSPQLPWFLRTDTNVDGTNLSTVASDENVSLPSDYLREDEEQEYGLFLYDEDAEDPWPGLTRDTYSIIKKSFLGEGTPSHFDIIGTTLYLRKIPNEIFTLRMIYFKSDDAIAAGTTENLWMSNASDWIMSEVGLIIASTVVVIPTIAASFKEEAQRAQRRIKIETTARIEAGAMRMMGDD
jgi:hypothetical protein